MIHEKAHIITMPTDTEVCFELAALEDDEIDRTAEALVLIARSIITPQIAARLSDVVRGERQVLSQLSFNF